MNVLKVGKILKYLRITRRFILLSASANYGLWSYVLSGAIEPGFHAAIVVAVCPSDAPRGLHFKPPHSSPVKHTSIHGRNLFTVHIEGVSPVHTAKDERQVRMFSAEALHA